MSWNQQPSWSRPQTDGPAIISSEKDAALVGAFLAKVYLWMFVGLLITSVTAFAVAASPALVEALIVNRLGFWLIVIAQLGVVFYLAARIDKIQPVTAAGLFILYSALVGVTSSVVLLVFTGASIVQTFVITAGMFGATALFGTVTKRSLAGVGHFMFMGLIGLVLASVVGIFWHNDALQFVI